MSDLLFLRQALSEYLSKQERSLREDQRIKKVANYRVQSEISNERLRWKENLPN